MTRRVSSQDSGSEDSRRESVSHSAKRRSVSGKAASSTKRKPEKSDTAKRKLGRVASGSAKKDNAHSISNAKSQSDGFVDARVMSSNEDVDARLLHAGVSSEGVFTRPKVIDFSQRLREKRQANAHVVMKRAAITVAALVTLGALLWFLLLSPVFLLRASSIQVSGTNTWVSSSRIEAIAKQQLDISLFVVSTGDMEEQIGELPGVTSATVKKDFPNGLSITVNAQRPAAVLRDAKGALTAVDKEARVLNAVGASVDGIPIIDVSSVGKGTDDAAVQQALKVLAVLPETMRTQITKVSAATQDSITTQISNGKYLIVWGDSSQMTLKKAVVDKIINDSSKIGDKHQVDVSAPLRPIIK
ncbi:MAG: FtsQ-type POTRA domain-containing protein [Bifidobacterium sp.]|jgi:cell division protein FtsQ|nr:FtsQ-type POTRA domain-containing protein [Bifidobacterium sp.]MCH4174700.1 FtsQ-type POTRA domain-containing protein [Bifidobacterium sp.]